MLSNTLLRRVEWGDCDPAGIVFNSNFFRWFDHGTTMLYEAAGLPKHKLLKTFGATGAALVDTRATFKIPCSWGDDVTITSSITDVRNSSFDVRHTLTKDGKLCVEGTEIRVWSVHDPDTGRLKSAPIPRVLVAKFRGE